MWEATWYSTQPKGLSKAHTSYEREDPARYGVTLYKIRYAAAETLISSPPTSSYVGPLTAYCHAKVEAAGLPMVMPRYTRECRKSTTGGRLTLEFRDPEQVAFDFLVRYVSPTQTTDPALYQPRNAAMSASAATTLLDSFKEALPKYTMSPELEKKQQTAKPPSTTGDKTWDMKVPQYLIKHPLEHWTKPAAQFLELDEPRRKLSSRQIYDWEKNNLKTEADVVGLAGKFLVKPVFDAINIKHNNQISNGAAWSKGGTRADLCFNIDGPHEKIVLVLEFKCRFYIKPDELRKALDEDEESQIQKLKTRGIMDLLSPGGHTAKHLKQVCASAKEHSCNYAALCDYESLVLIKLSPRSIDEPRYERKSFFRRADITIVPPQYFRLALLGFLDEAIQRHVDIYPHLGSFIILGQIEVESSIASKRQMNRVPRARVA
ncbi:hypothetical protein T440DRAFT_482742 [Plenodomus tracheiphilus IPT5]|uniref:Uncharacterized protein n=1 Tax=Plenodomus tracheiphilus IPT5 TaxID=1408161 RepID=A0A6A7AVP1_9PLEO|nr:hypothetical protein T440DRAFT_482742 [Plenodomus tracheiphilus IPT5]